MAKNIFLTFLFLIFGFDITFGTAAISENFKIIKSFNKEIQQNIKALMDTIYYTMVKDCSDSNLMHQDLVERMTNISMIFKNYSDNSLNFDLPFDLLYKCLFSKKYDKEIAPYLLMYENIFGFSDYLYTVNYSIILNELIKLDASGTLGFTATFDFQWHDPRLKWSQTTSIPNWSFPGVLTVGFKKIWFPELRVMNCQKRGCAIMPENQTKAFIFSSGNVELAFSDFVESSCEVDFTYFPFDKQTCTLNISFVNIDDEDEEDTGVKLNKLDMGHSYYMAESDEWIVVSFDHSPAPVFNYELEPHSQEGKWKRTNKLSDWSNSTVVLKITAIRIAAFYVTNVVVPILVIIIISLGTVIYSAGSTEKVNCLLTVILAFVFFQTLLASEIPKSPTESRLGLYVMWAMLLSAVNMFFTFATMIAQRRVYTIKYLPPKFLLYIIIKYNKLLGRPTKPTKAPNRMEPTEPDMIPNFIHNSIFYYFSHALDSRQNSEKEWIRTVWYSFAELLDIFFDIIFVTLNIVIFVLYMLPLLRSYFNNLEQTPFFIDT